MGLAMSRSLGDDIAHQAGVSSEPEVMEHEIDPSDQVKTHGDSDSYSVRLHSGCPENIDVLASRHPIERYCILPYNHLWESVSRASGEMRHRSSRTYMGKVSSPTRDNIPVSAACMHAMNKCMQRFNGGSAAIFT